MVLHEYRAADYCLDERVEAMEVQEFENGQRYRLSTNFTLADCLDSDGRKNIDAFVIALFFTKKLLTQTVTEKVKPVVWKK